MEKEEIAVENPTEEKSGVYDEEGVFAEHDAAVYDFERPESDSRVAVHVPECETKAPRNVRRAISETLKYYNAIKNLPLWYVLKGSKKLVTTEEQICAEKENEDLRVFKKIEKLKKKDKMFVEKRIEFLKTYKGKKTVVDRKRKPIFKKIIVVARENKEEHSKLIGEFARCVQRQINRRKKESATKKEVPVHPTHIQITSRIPEEFKINPIGFFVSKLFERDRIESGDQSEKLSSLAPSQEEFFKKGKDE